MGHLGDYYLDVAVVWERLRACPSLASQVVFNQREKGAADADGRGRGSGPRKEICHDPDKEDDGYFGACAARVPASTVSLTKSPEAYRNIGATRNHSNCCIVLRELEALGTPGSVAMS